MSNSAHRSVWGSRIGFILASAGSAVGLGAIWKFPYMAGNNGGSAFILPYILLTIAIGFVVLLIEMALGRAARKGAAHALGQFGGRLGRCGLHQRTYRLSYSCLLSSHRRLVLALPHRCLHGQRPDYRYRAIRSIL